MRKLSGIFFLMVLISFEGSTQNVGIGTASPTQKLDVAGNINTTGNLMVNGAVGADGQIIIYYQTMN